ncbi:MAG TPA: patatin-like phospholipase family protein [Myxococcota bacterium]|nr:patatin-like phospholipase family protein [Myxococcota bacterium]
MGTHGLPADLRSIDLDAVRPPPLPPLDEVAIAPRPPTGPHPRIPFENLAFEGGGAKGMAYLGALRVLEDAGLYPDHVLRVAGTSSGSFFAAMVACGASSDDLRQLLYDTDLVKLLKDARFGRFSCALNLWSEFGFHPGQRLLEFLGELLAERTGAMDVTFAQLLERCGRELCVPIANITRMCAEYCHPKTTPHMPVRLAIGMSMSLPVLMRPYRLVHRMGSPSWEEEDLYTDGGILCNFPLHVFDGWWLSMKPKDSFVRRLGPLIGTGEFDNPLARFDPRDGKTLGFTVFEMGERDVSAEWLTEEGGPPPRPDTILARIARDREKAIDDKRQQAMALHHAFGRLMRALDACEHNDDGLIDREEISGLFTRGGLSEEDALMLFGTTSVEDIFGLLDSDGSGVIEPEELVRFMDARNIGLTARAMGCRRSENKQVGSFMNNVFQTVLIHVRKMNLRREDKGRTVPIATDYVSTTNFALQEADRSFLIESGARATRAFLDGLEGGDP